MRASSLFALTLALLAGVGAVIAARQAGWLGRPDAPKEKEVTVLVAARNLFPGDLIDASYVRTRPLRPDEKEDYEKAKADFLPPVPAAASLRVANKPIETDVPIRRKDLQDMVKPEPLHARLLPNMRAVNITVPKDQSAGGLIQEGEWVDVYLTSAIRSGDKETTRTAPLATGLRVIAKRNVLWKVLAPLPDNKPVNFTLEANTYRAALIEYGKSKGTLTLVPVSAAEQKQMEERRKGLLAGNEPGVLPVAFGLKAVADVNAEESRVEAFTRGDMPVGTGDLVKIFDLTTPPPPRSNFAVEHFNGLSRTHIAHYGPDGQFLGTEDMKKARYRGPSRQARAEEEAAAAFQFGVPGCGSPSGCKSCGKKKGS